MGLLNFIYQYFSDEILWGARFSQSAVLCLKGNVNIGSFGQSDIDKVILESLPRHSAQAMARMSESGFSHPHHHHHHHHKVSKVNYFVGVDSIENS